MFVSRSMQSGKARQKTLDKFRNRILPLVVVGRGSQRDNFCGIIDNQVLTRATFADDAQDELRSFIILICLGYVALGSFGASAATCG